MVRDTVVRIADGSIVRSGFQIFDNTLGPASAFVLEPGQEFETPTALTDWSMIPGTSKQNGIFGHTFALVAVATSVPDLRGDTGEALIIKQRRKARHDALSEVVGLLERLQGREVDIGELCGQLETLGQNLLARASNSEERSQIPGVAQSVVLSAQWNQRQRGKTSLTAPEFSRFLQHYREERATSAKALIP